MTTLLKKAMKKLERLPKKRQDSYASIIFDELDSELRWNKLFVSTSGKQQKSMEKMVLKNIKKETSPLDQFLNT
jgi:hypothetical protein